MHKLLKVNYKPGQQLMSKLSITDIAKQRNKKTNLKITYRDKFMAQQVLVELLN
jgi:hypothetical protein